MEVEVEIVQFHHVGILNILVVVVLMEEEHVLKIVVMVICNAGLGVESVVSFHQKYPQ